jgi:hypothetical protein
MTEADDAIEARVQIWDTEARQAWEAGDFTRSRQLFQKSLEAWRGRANSIFPVIHVTQAMRFEPGYDPAAARLLLEGALSLAEHTGDEATIALVEAHLALVAQEQGDYVTSFSLAQQLVSKSLRFTMTPPTWAVFRHMGSALMGLGGMRMACVSTRRERRYSSAFASSQTCHRLFGSITREWLSECWD